MHELTDCCLPGNRIRVLGGLPLLAPSIAQFDRYLFKPKKPQVAESGILLSDSYSLALICTYLAR